MGLLTEGKPLSWEETQQFVAYIKKHGIEQFINLWKLRKDRCCDSFKWGDETEYLLVYTPKNTRIARLSLQYGAVQQRTQQYLEENEKKLDIIEQIIVHPEYGSFMIEATPKYPYGDTWCDLLLVETNMAARRKWIEMHLDPAERIVTLAAFPTLGVGIHTHPHTQPNGPIAQSQYISDVVINQTHPRFGTLTKNIRERRGKKVDIRVPTFKDIHTKPNDKEIHMDAMAFGMGCCCLQVTFQARNIREARHLYDQLAVLTPVVMALTAATPVLRGKLSDLDVRWTVISQSVDDRTDSEFGRSPLGYRGKRILKSRYDTIDCYLSLCDWNHPEYNDIPLVYDEASYKRMIDEGIDPLMAKHIAHLFIRDPLVVFSDLVELDDTKTGHHFETIQSTNWQNVRFKPPPMENPDVGWRVEFRPMEIQITDFENAAFSVFITLVSRAILAFDLNFYIPLSKVDENFGRAHERDAARSQKFYWRCCNRCNPSCERKSSSEDIMGDIMHELSLEEILCGSESRKGLIQIVEDYLDLIKADETTHKLISRYLTFIRRRACGEVMTTAQWIRDFVHKHPLYRKDSNVSEYITRDLLDTVHKIAHGKIKAPSLLGDDVDIGSSNKGGLVVCAECKVHMNGNGNGKGKLLGSELLPVTTARRSKL